MNRRVNYGKILLVVFITILIWVWADMAQDKQETFEGFTISLDRSRAGNRWVSFDNMAYGRIDKVTLRGPTSRIDGIRSQLRAGQPALKFFLAPEDMGMAEPGTYKLDVLDFLRRSGQLRDLGVTAVDCEPEKMDVVVHELQKRRLAVRCLDQHGSIIKHKSIEPPEVEMLVPKDWGPERLHADVVLTEGDIEQARVAGVELPAKVAFAEDETRVVPTKVKVTMPSALEKLQSYQVPGTIVYAFSPNLQGRYTVELLSGRSDLTTVRIRATEAARDAYASQPYHIVLSILDGDEKSGAELTRPVKYYLPENYVRAGEIELDQPPAVARFRLVPVGSEKPASSVQP